MTETATERERERERESERERERDRDRARARARERGGREIDVFWAKLVGLTTEYVATLRVNLA